MSSTFFGLHIAASGLRAANAALNTTANNISNVNTTGYSRQEVKQEANDPLRVFATYGCAGAGVNTIAIERIRESFYDTKYRDNETKLVLRDFKVSGGLTADTREDAPVEDLRHYGINSQEETVFEIAECKRGKMILRSDYAEIVLEKF